ncbi:MAG: DnaD domain protein [Oscillospiraceae bacterium]|jgi:DnaD/phage-associated family protein|nr:DnaD domain protein [Oscillospiraceae bacterium]
MARFKLPEPESLALPRAAAEKLIRARDAEGALLYLHMLATGGTRTYEQTAGELGRSTGEIRDTVMKLSDLGLVLVPPEEERGDAADKRRAPAKTGEIYTRPIGETKKLAETDGDGVFHWLAQGVQSVVGKPLSSDDLARLYAIRAELELPPDVILLLVHFCADELRAEKGDGARPTMRYIEKAAYVWARDGIATHDDAEKYMLAQSRRREGADAVREALQLPKRALSPAERKYVSAWLDMGFPPETIALAYDRTVLQTGKLAWSYMDSILRSWLNKGLFTPEEIAEKDTRAPRDNSRKNQSAASGAGTGLMGEELERVRRMIESMRKAN